MNHDAIEIGLYPCPRTRTYFNSLPHFCPLQSTLYILQNMLQACMIRTLYRFDSFRLVRTQYSVYLLYSGLECTVHDIDLPTSGAA